jgi:drug/metabolite transporter (DMT)-like permease
VTTKPATAALPAYEAASLGRPPANRAAVYLAFAAIYLIWGSTFLAIRFAVATIPPLYTAGTRHFIAGSILLSWCLVKGYRPTWAQVRSSVVIGGFFFLGGHGTLHWAEQRVPSGLAALLIAGEPIWVHLLTCAVERKWRMNAALLTGVLLGLTGVGALFGGGLLQSSKQAMLAAGVVVIGAISWSMGIVYSRRSHLTGKPVLLSAMSLLSGSIMLLTVGTMTGEWRGFSIHAVSSRSWWALGYMIVFGSMVTFTAYNWLMEHYPPTLVATHTYVNPIVAVLLGWWLAGETVTPAIVLSGAVVIAAVMLVDRGMARLHVAT